MNGEAADQVYVIARRSVVRTLRQPANVIAPLVFPLMLLAVNSAGLKAETHLPGFPTTSILAFILAVGLIAGVRFASGPAGVLVLIALYILVVLAFGAIGLFMALRTGSGEAIQGLFPLFFVFLFISSMAIPRNLMSVTWFHDAATVNPVSYLIEGVRSLIIIGWDGQALALGFGIAATVSLVAVLFASRALDQRLAGS
jgi:ABC-2 type transport system permease protein